MAWLRHEEDDASPAPSVEQIRAAIGELTERRAEAAAAASAALLGQTEVQQALHAQRHRLRQALSQLDGALELARRVAQDTARDEGELAALPFRVNVDGLAVQRDVVFSAAGQLDQLDVVSRSQVAAAREVLARSRAIFDEALHEQLRLLVALERLERTRTLLAARAARGQRRP